MLTTSQKSILKSAILGDSALNVFPNTSDGNYDLAVKLSVELAAPAFTVWKTHVLISEIGDAMISTEVSGLTTANLNRLMVFAAYNANSTMNPSLVDRRAGFDDVFNGAGGAGTRARLLVLWKRLATRVEKILVASGTGSDASPAILGFEGAISKDDVEDARNS